MEPSGAARAGCGMSGDGIPCRHQDSNPRVGHGVLYSVWWRSWPGLHLWYIGLLIGRQIPTCEASDATWEDVAIWPTEPVDHEVVAVATGPGGIIWTGSSDGAVLKWTTSNDNGRIVPELFLFGHQSPIRSLVTCINGLGKDLLVSVDSEGMFCSWDCISGLCMAMVSHPELGGAIGSIAHCLGGSNVCFSLDHAQNGVEGETGSPRRLHALVALDGASLELLEVWHPVVSVELFEEGEHGSAGKCCLPVLLDLVSFPKDKKSYHDLKHLIGISSAGMLLYWDLSEDKKSPNEIAAQLLPDQIPPLLTPLGAASFSPDGCCILLISQAGQCLLKARRSLEEGLPVNYTCLPRQSSASSGGSSEMSNLAGGVILQQNLDPGKDVESGYMLLVWDWSGNLALQHAEGSKERVLVSTPGVLHSSRGVNGGYVNFVQDGNKAVFGVWSTWMESEVTGDASDESRLKSDAGVCALRLCDQSLSPLASMSLSRIWYPDKGDMPSPEATNVVDNVQKSSCGASACQVTCLAVVGGVRFCPLTLVQGFSNGEIIFLPLADYAIPGALDKMREARTIEKESRLGHRGPVVCFVEILYEPPISSSSGGLDFMEDVVAIGNHGQGVIASGGEDGSVIFWSLEPKEVGKPLFAVHPHTGSVQQILCPPDGCGNPWSGCVASVGNDGIISLISLQTKQVERILSAHPFQKFENISWDGQRGFMACLGSISVDFPIMVIWDLYSCRRERLLAGEQAESGFKEFCDRVKENSDSRYAMGIPASFHDANASAVVEVDPNEKVLKVVPGPKQDIAFLEMNLHGLLPVKQHPSSIEMDAPTSAALGCALSLLHAWGIHYDTDVHLRSMLQSLSLTQHTPSQVTPSGTSDDTTPPVQSSSWSISLTQGIITSDLGPVTVQVPYHVPPVFATDRTLFDKEGRGKNALIGPLWRYCPDFVTRELVGLVAVSKKLMHDGLNEAVCSACSNLVRLYAIEFLQIVPQVCNPSLAVLVDHWEDTNPILRESTRVLLASMTNPGNLLGDGADQEDQVRSVGASEVGQVLSLYESGKGDFQTDLDPGFDALVLIAGAICCVHSRLIPEQLLVAAAPLLAGLASSTRSLSKSQVTATAMLADALSAIDGHKWLERIGDTHVFLHRVFDACDKCFKPFISDTAAEKKPHRHTKSTGGVNLTSGGLENALNEDIREGKPADDGIESGLPGKSTQSKSPFKMLMSSRGKLANRLVSRKITRSFAQPMPSIPSGDVAPSSVELPARKMSPEKSEIVGYREGLVAILAAVGGLDLQLFLHSMGSRLTNLTQKEPYCILSMTAALSRLLHQRDGPSKMIPHLPLMLSVLALALDPAQPTLRSIAEKGVHAVLSELAAAFPMVDSERVNNMIAVGHALAQISRPADNAAPEAIAIYDMKTGGKKKSLCLGRVLQQTGGHMGNSGTQNMDQTKALGVGALSFRKDGDVLAAYCPGAGVLCVWDLRTSWQHRLIKAAMLLEPIKVIQIQKPPGASKGGSALSATYKISWQLMNQIAVLEDGDQLASVELHLGG